MSAIRLMILAALLTLPASITQALSFRADFSAQFNGFANVQGDGESLLEIPMNGVITGSYSYDDSPWSDRMTGAGSGTREMHFHDSATHASISFANETVSIFTDRVHPMSGVAHFRTANDHFFDWREDPDLEPCDLLFGCGFEDRYRVVYQDGDFAGDYWNHLIIGARTEWEVGEPASGLLTGLDFTDIPDLSQVSITPTFFLWVIRPTGSVQVTGNLTHLELVVVPEPSTGVLFCVGLGLLSLKRDGKQRGTC